MELLSFRSKTSKGAWRLGAKLGDKIGDLGLGYVEWTRTQKLPSAQTQAHFSNLKELLETGEDGLQLAAEVAAFLAANPSLLIAETAVELDAPIADPPKIICIGLNYRDHCSEYGVPVPKEPVIFSKFPTAVIGPGQPIVRPKGVTKLDCEGELAVIIGRRGRFLSQEQSLEHVAGYCIFNDVTSRDLQTLDGQWQRSKSFDTFAPMGPILKTRDEIEDPHNLTLRVKVNGAGLQRSNTSNMIFDIPYLVSFLSSVFTLLPGDVIATGTPAGVGAYHDPPVFLKAGDKVTVDIAELGSLSNPVVDENN